jgi:hypothetical protein
MRETARRAIVVLRTTNASFKRVESYITDNDSNARQFADIAVGELVLAQSIVRECPSTVGVEGQIVVLGLALQHILENIDRVEIKSYRAELLQRGMVLMSGVIETIIRDLHT